MTTASFLIILSLQVALDRQGFSSNTLDGQWGRKSEVALATWCACRGVAMPPTPEEAWHMHFAGERNLWRTDNVTTADVAALTHIPKSPDEKAKLPTMGYETLQEMFAERGHLSERALQRLNPHVAWPNPPIGTAIRLPDFVEADREAARQGRRRSRPAIADTIRVSLSRYEITVFDKSGNLVALFPCSIAADKAKLPKEGEIHIATIVADPNYTYTPEYGKKRTRLIFPPGPNNPVGVAWAGLTLPGYGIHGTPTPERIGRAESHGCFRLANWNARRLLALCDAGTSVTIEK